MSVTKKQLEKIVEDFDITIQRCSRGGDGLLLQGHGAKAQFYIALLLCDIRDVLISIDSK